MRVRRWYASNRYKKCLCSQSVDGCPHWHNEATCAFENTWHQEQLHVCVSHFSHFKNHFISNFNSIRNLNSPFVVVCVTQTHILALALDCPRPLWICVDSLSMLFPLYYSFIDIVCVWLCVAVLTYFACHACVLDYVTTDRLDSEHQTHTSTHI